GEGEAGRRPGPAITGGIPELIGKACRVDQELLRHATADDTGPADPEFLSDHHARAITGGDAGRPDAAGARADDEEIDIRHGRPLPDRRARSDVVPSL